MNIANTKQRILEYLDFKGVSISKFFIDTGIKRGFLDTDKLNSVVSDVFLATIVATYDDLNLYWLITGKGEMLQDDLAKAGFVSEPVAKYLTNGPELIETQRDLIAMQKDEIKRLKERLEKVPAQKSKSG